jgi:type I restriction enzyme S subunit
MDNEKDFKDLPEGWKWVRLGEVIEYEQPQKYIVSAENYEDKSGTPVLTAGKTFILGYTSENFGIYDALPVILFDDFTTDTKFVNFPFKVKSSATKLLKAKDKNINLFYVFNTMQMIRVKPGSEHKRFWISEYSKLYIPLPPLPEQQKIAEILETIDNAIEKTDKIIEKYKRIKQGLMQDLLTKGIDENGNIRDEKTHKFKDSPLGRIPEEWEVIRLGEVAFITSSKRIYYNEYLTEGVPFFRSKEIIELSDGSFAGATLYISHDKFKYIANKFGVPEAGDILITAVGTLGIVFS